MAASSEVEELLLRISARLLQVEPNTADARIEHVLGLVGLYLQAQRIVLYQLDRPENRIHPSHWWTRTTGRAEPNQLPVSDFPWILEKLDQLEPVAVCLDDLPPEAVAERAVLVDRGMCSAMLIPSCVGGATRAVLALYHDDPTHHWPDRWLVPLQIVCNQLTEVSLRVAAEQAAEREAVRFRMFSQASNEGILVHRDGVVVDVNDALVALLGTTRERLVGSHVSERLHPEESAVGEARFRDGLSSLETSRVRRDDGSWVWCEQSSRLVVTPEGRFRLVALRDISASREAEQLLRESEERFRILSESTYDGIAVSDGSVILQANAPFARMFGYGPHEVVGLSHDDLLTPESVDSLLDRTEGGGHDAVELEGVRKDGTRFPVLVRGRWCHMNGRLVRIGGYLDLTAQEQAERERRTLEAQVRHAQKLESLGLLAGGIAHDFNNLLVGVLGNAELALLDPALPGSVTQALERIRSAAQRASELTNQMLAYSGKGRFEVRAVDVNGRIREMAGLLKISHSKSVRLQLDLADDLWPVEADPAQVDQVVMNLVTNAGDAIGSAEGTIRVATSCSTLDGPGPPDVMDEPLAPGRYVLIEVSDSGVGMPPEVVQRIFEPFFSTKFTGRGLGLAAVQGIVRSHDGAIEVTSHAGEGTTFRVWLPAAPSLLLAAPHGVAGPRPVRRGRVLVADDEPQVREVTRRMLERVGYEVELAADGLEAVDRLSGAPDGYDLVLLDLTMPGPDGHETLRRLRNLRQDLPVVLCSGYSQPFRTESGPTTFLQKPFRLDDLVNALDDVRCRPTPRPAGC